ncbi:MAG: archaeosortase/exosortase family protein [Pyrinomonadaceae bacterium]
MNTDKREFFSKLVIILLLQFAGFWAIWSWYAARLLSFDGESWSFVALGGAILLCLRQSKKSENISLPLVLPAIFVLLYAASFPFAAPILIKAILAVTAISLTLSRAIFGQVLHLGVYVLLLLSLPLVASLNFFAGFPLRVIAGEATAFLLRLNGLNIWREGVCLHFGEQLISIDAPCSGVKMLWFGLFLTAVLIIILQLNLWRSAAAFALAFVIILLGNIARASALFYTEAKIIDAPVWTHEAVGVFSFVLVAVGIVFVTQTLKGNLKWHAGQFS